ncbi:MAG: preprotein translocase subunit SecE [Saprospiraceae bacterium]|nr:preprotein translocase subunit SecE [Saprospiraceae bacterium]MBK7795044.1 preprotein translocase subunit SecE [Saprospiraceae bacterium]MBK8153515.1 preprotein translocase subunit SecE [Saprospiraceae bacterium]MBK9376863.1 preprotein translocase subunit SecE [Saprospiraceae bacterium]MBL0262068.1 preprotein translocase subunit SecE [Saprospiraceae bacterium]
MEKLKLYLKESYHELVDKVTWPTWQNLFDSARVVIIASLLIALVIFVMDLVTNTVLNFIYSL